MKILKHTAILSFVVCTLLPFEAIAEEAKVTNRVLITNANIFDGEHEALAKGMSLLVEGNKIAKIAKSIALPKGATVIDTKGKTLIPGLIDAHWHT